MTSRPRYFELLEVLTRREVDFIVVGGVAAIIEGVPITTLDLDVVYDRAPANLERLLGALESVNASYRDPAGRHIIPTVEHLATLRTNLLNTDLGPLDVLASIGENVAYADLLSSTRVRSIGELRVRILDLAIVIETKEVANRPKDLAMLPVLRETLALKMK